MIFFSFHPQRRRRVRAPARRRGQLPALLHPAQVREDAGDPRPDHPSDAREALQVGGDRVDGAALQVPGQLPAAAPLGLGVGDLHYLTYKGLRRGLCSVPFRPTTR